MEKLVFEVYKYVGNVKDFKLEKCVCFSDVNESLKFLKSYLNSQGIIRPVYTTIKSKDVYKTLKEYEDQLAESELG